MLYGVTAVRDNIRNRDGKRVFYLGTGDQLTSDARDYLRRERIEILPAKDAKPERWKLLSGGFSEEKGEDMTHLNGDTLVKKTHPRIRFRGEVDALEAEILLCCRTVPEMEGELSELLQLSRELIRADVLEQPLQQKTLCGMTEEEIRKRSHFPQDFYGIPHFMPQPGDTTEILCLNRLRSAVRRTELSAAEAFQDREGNCTRPDMVKALNRMSSMVYLMMIRMKAKMEGSAYGTGRIGTKGHP